MESVSRLALLLAAFEGLRLLDVGAFEGICALC